MVKNSKKVIISVIAAVVLVSFLLLSLTSSKKSIDKKTIDFMQISEDEGISFINGFGPEKVIYVDNDKLYVRYIFEGIAGMFDMGLFTFVDGVPQKFVLADHQPDYMQLISIRPDTVNTYLFEIDLENCDQGEDHWLYITFLINPFSLSNDRPQIFDSETALHFKYENSNSPDHLFWKPSQELIDVVDTDDHDWMDGINSFIYISPDNWQKNSLNLILGGKVQQSYRTTVFIDHKPVIFNNGTSYLDLINQPENITQFRMRLKNEISTDIMLYVVSIPHKPNLDEEILPIKSNMLMGVE